MTWHSMAALHAYPHSLSLMKYSVPDSGIKLIILLVANIGHLVLIVVEWARRPSTDTLLRRAEDLWNLAERLGTGGPMPDGGWVDGK